MGTISIGELTVLLRDEAFQPVGPALGFVRTFRALSAVSARERVRERERERETSLSRKFHVRPERIPGAPCARGGVTLFKPRRRRRSEGEVEGEGEGESERVRE